MIQHNLANLNSLRAFLHIAKPYLIFIGCLYKKLHANDARKISSKALNLNATIELYLTFSITCSIHPFIIINSSLPTPSFPRHRTPPRKMATEGLYFLFLFLIKRTTALRLLAPSAIHPPFEFQIASGDFQSFY
jgi:hypothetical protein